MAKLKRDVESDLEEFVGEGKLVMGGVVEKKTFASYTYSYLILLEGFKLLEVPSHNTREASKTDLAPLSPEYAAEQIDDLKFRMLVDECVWKVRSVQAGEWVKALNGEYEKSKA